MYEARKAAVFCVRQVLSVTLFQVCSVQTVLNADVIHLIFGWELTESHQVSGGFRGGVRVVRLNPTLGPNYFIFMGKCMTNQVKC